MNRDPGAQARSYGRAAGLLSVGVGFAGVLTYVFFAVASHELSRADYGEIVVLWAAIFLTVSTLYRPVEQLLSRTIAERRARAQDTREPLRVAATIQLGLALAFAALALALREPLTDDLLSGNDALYWILVASVLAYSAGYFGRGFCAGNRRFGLYSVLLLVEAVARVSFPLAVAVGIASGQTAVALGIALAPVASLLVVALALELGPRAGAGGTGIMPSADRREVEFTLAHGWGFAASVLLIMLSEQIFLNAGPLLLNASEGAAAAGFIFNLLMIARAPLVLFQAIATSLLPHLTRLRSTGTETDAEAFGLSVRMTLVLVAAFTSLVAAVVFAVGPELMQLTFGEKFTYDRLDLEIVTVGMGCYLAAVTFNQAALAQGQARRAAACFVGCAAGFVAWSLLPLIDDEFLRVEIGFAGAAAALFGLLFLLYRAPRPRPEDVPAPDSPKEIEARLAAGDEAA